MQQENQGEGNREADRRYREGVRETVEETTAEERARRARELTPAELEAARAAEDLAKAKKRPASSDREL
jgi:signal transduction histidine kinase